MLYYSFRLLERCRLSLRGRSGTYYNIIPAEGPSVSCQSHKNMITRAPLHIAHHII